MSKLTKKQRAALEDIQADMRDVIAYIMRDDVAVARVGEGEGTTTLHFHNADRSKNLYPITKEIGSKLTYLFNARRKLDAFLSEVN